MKNNEYEGKKKNKDNGLADILSISALGIHLVFSSLVGLGIGYFIDTTFKTKPVFIVIFFIIGVIAGFREIIRQVRKYNGTTAKKNGDNPQ
ncbi:MAG: AtpZ/AtpI family protein [Chitinivibrionales bacterium]|nr:AtpZ/AtpI family protein [Chitinivibrionales bacterium]